MARHLFAVVAAVVFQLINPPRQTTPIATDAPPYETQQYLFAVSAGLTAVGLKSYFQLCARTRMLALPIEIARHPLRAPGAE
jgi:H+/Cl- antiporter ClcA